MPVKPGKCFLVGAGPGDLGLATLRAKQLIEQADVIFYDALCNPEMLAWTREDAEIVFAGKRAGEHTLSQDEINALLVEKARQGKAVVRLAYAGIPVTHREQNSHVTFFTGHEDVTKTENALDYDALVRLGGTQVMLMGVERLDAITRKMLARGSRPDLPVALVRWGTTARQKTIVGTLATIAERVRVSGFEAPAIAIFGDVVLLRDELSWFEDQPLFGKRIVVTRTRRQAGILSSELRVLGADVIELPTIRIAPPANLREFAELVQDAHSYDWIVFTSPNGVEAFFEIFFKLYDDAREIGGAKIATIGPATAQRVRDFHLRVDMQPEEFVAEALLREFEKLGGIENLKVLIARAERARDLLPKGLAGMGAIVDEAFAYRTVAETSDVTGARRRFVEEGADLITFTSSSTVENFLDLKLPWPAGMKVASIGPVTSATARERGLSVDVEANQHDIPGLISAIRQFFGS
jgi:uroporphyrinogen III methyltransferase/synthase